MTQEAAQAASEGARALDALCRAARHYGLYPPGHPGSGAAVSAAREAVAAVVREDGFVLFAAAGDQLVVNGTQAPDDAVTARLVAELQNRDMRALKLSAELDAAETEAVLQMLSMDVPQLRNRGGPAAFIEERELTNVDVVELSYEGFVPESVAGRDAAPEDVLLHALDADPSALADMEIADLVGMLDAPQQLANKLVSWLTARGGSGGYGGEGGSGIGPGVGDGIGTGGEIPLILDGHEVDRGHRAGAMLALALQRLGETVRNRSPSEWEKVRQKLTDVFRSLSLGLRRKVLQADVVMPDADFDVLAAVGESLDMDEALELLGKTSEEAIADPSVTLERLLRRLAPTQARLRLMEPAVKEHLAELGLPDEASGSVVGRLLDALAKSRGPDAEDGKLGSFRTDEATRAKRRAEGEDLFRRLDEDAMWRARTSVCLELLGAVQDAETYLKVLSAVESGLAHISPGNGDGLAVRVADSLRRHQHSPDLSERCRQQSAKLLASLESVDTVENVQAAIERASGEERGRLIALLPSFGASGVSALYEMLKTKAHVQDLPAILDALARAEHEAADRDVDHEESGEQSDFRSVLLDPRWQNTQVAIEHLAAHEGAFATKYLSITLTQGYFALRVAVIQALAVHRSPGSLELLICALTNPEHGIQEIAATSLGRIRDSQAVAALMRAAEPQSLFDKRTRVRAAAMLALGSLGYTAAIDMLAQTLRHKPLFRREAGTQLSVAAATALGRIGTDRARAQLDGGTRDRRRAVRDACRKALGGTKEARR